jgi:hypothetical protein
MSTVMVKKDYDIHQAFGNLPKFAKDGSNYQIFINCIKGVCDTVEVSFTYQCKLDGNKSDEIIVN